MDELETPELVSAKCVVYIGQFGIREIDTESWDNVDVKDQNKIVWDQVNNWSVPVDMFTDDALNYISSQPDFVVKDVEVPRVD